MSTVTFTEIKFTVLVSDGPGNPRDFVGLYRPDDPDNQRPQYDWNYVSTNKKSPKPDNGTKEGRVTLNLTNPIGMYEFRLCNISEQSGVDIYSTISRSSPFNFSWPTGIVFSAPPGVITNSDGSWDIETVEGAQLNIRPM